MATTTNEPEIILREACVLETKSYANETVVRLNDGDELHLPPFLYLQPGDILRLDSSEDLPCILKKIEHPRPSEAGWIKLLPSYSVTETSQVGNHTLSVTYRERRSQGDWNQIKALEQFHYRGNGLNKIVGRRTVLLADLAGVGVVGYGVLSATVVANKARFNLLKTNVGDQLRSKFINKIARVPRIVVHPEFRGLGIGARLASHLIEFAREHWDIRGHAPHFVEVIASMVQYHRFFECAGFTQAGETSGHQRIIKPIYGRGGWDERPNSSNYAFSGGTRAKPYLIFPLEDSIGEAIKAKGFGVAKPVAISRPLISSSELAASAKGLAVSATTAPPKSPNCDEVYQVFGLKEVVARTPVFNKLDCDIKKGEVTLLTGASGSGKSTLLTLLAYGKDALPQIFEVSGQLLSLGAVDPPEVKPDLALIDHFGTDVSEAIRILNAVGLAEAHLYLKTPNALSEGQKHRFRLAMYIALGGTAWAIDEFLTGLDPLTSAIVAKGVRKLAYVSGSTLVAAAANTDAYVHSLMPNQLIQLKWASTPTIYRIRLSFRKRAGSYQFGVRNMAATDLHDVSIMLTNRQGQKELIARIPSLKRFGFSGYTSIDLHKIDAFSAVTVMTNEGVGDVLRFAMMAGDPLGSLTSRNQTPSDQESDHE